MQYVSAHLAKIHGLDWDPNNEFSLATASQDCTAKVRINPSRGALGAMCSPYQAVQYVSAYLAKIHGLEWDPNNEFSLASASQDCTAKGRTGDLYRNDYFEK